MNNNMCHPKLNKNNLETENIQEKKWKITIRFTLTPFEYKPNFVPLILQCKLSPK